MLWLEQAPIQATFKLLDEVTLHLPSQVPAYLLHHIPLPHPFICIAKLLVSNFLLG
jgi:hypothetical protein